MNFSQIKSRWLKTTIASKWLVNNTFKECFKAFSMTPYFAISVFRWLLNWVKLKTWFRGFQFVVSSISLANDVLKILHTVLNLIPMKKEIRIWFIHLSVVLSRPVFFNLFEVAEPKMNSKKLAEPKLPSKTFAEPHSNFSKLTNNTLPNLT